MSARPLLDADAVDEPVRPGLVLAAVMRLQLDVRACAAFDDNNATDFVARLGAVQRDMEAVILIDERQRQQ